MKTLVITFTGTGNTLFLANLLPQYLKADDETEIANRVAFLTCDDSFVDNLEMDG